VAVSAPTDKRFRRAHVSPARKRSWFAFSRKRAAILAVVGALLVLAAYRAVELVLSAEALTVTRITVSGNERLSRGEVLSLLDGLAGAGFETKVGTVRGNGLTGGRLLMIIVLISVRSGHVCSHRSPRASPFPPCVGLRHCRSRSGRMGCRTASRAQTGGRTAADHRRFIARGIAGR